MNRSLMWGLIATCALSAWSLSGTPRCDPTQKVGSVLKPAARPVAETAMRSPNTVAQAEATSTTWPKPDMDVAVRSPLERPSLSPRTQQLQLPAVTLPPPPPPQANYRFWGRMSLPDKHVLLFLAKGQDGVPLAIQTGSQLDAGKGCQHELAGAYVPSSDRARFGPRAPRWLLVPGWSKST